MTELTARQAEVYAFVRQGIESGFPPTLREIADRFGFRSTMASACHLRALEKKGYLRRDARMRSRGLFLADSPAATVAVSRSLPKPWNVERRERVDAVVAAARAFVAERPFADVALTNAVRDLEGDES